jgi:signal transduction histidine kinase/ligand-binding sensor domain-containing protein/AraC-like DNA-binding protein/CheY-like chemotaxis protein
MRLYSCVFSIFFTLLISPLYATTVTDFRETAIGNQLINNTITAITKDGDGFLWLVTRGELVRFDGISYTYPTSEVNRTLFKDENVVQKLYFQAPDKLYICSNLGLFIFNIRNHKLTQFQSFAGVRINSIVFTKSGVMIVNSVEGLVFFDPQNDKKELFVHFSKNKESNLFPLGTSAVSDSFGNLWVYANNLLLHISHPEGITDATNPVTATSIHIDTLLSLKTPHQLFVDKFDILWWWDRQSLKSGQITPFNTLNPLNTSTVEATSLAAQGNNIIFCDRGRGNILISRNEKGEETGRQKILLNDQFDDLSNTTNAFYSDSDNRIWIGTRDGLFMFRDEVRSPFLNIKSDLNSANSIKHSTVSDVLVENDNLIWVATANGFNRIHFVDKSKEKYEIENFIDIRPEKNPLDGNKIQSMAIDRSGLLWLGTKDNLKFFDPRTKKFINKPFILKKLQRNAFVRAIYKDTKDNIWVGFDSGGVYRYDCKSDTISPVDIEVDGHRLKECMTIKGSSTGDIWIGTRQSGLFRVFPDGSKTTYSYKRYEIANSDSSLTQSSNYITTIFTDPNNNTWVGTAEGLFLYDYEKDAFKRIIFSDLDNHSQYISGIINDNRGNLWISTLTGIHKYHFADNRSLFFPLYNRNLTRVSYRFTSTKDSNGIIYLTGINGLTYFDPGLIKSDTTTFKVYFSDFKVQNRSVSIGSEILPQDINYMDKVILGYADNQFSFSFSALTYEKIENIRYAYMLEGIDKDWINTGPEIRNISYGNLPWGKYVLKLRCTNASGEWQSDIRHIQIIVKPPIWAAWYSFIFYIIILASIAWLIIRLWRMRAELRTRSLINSMRLKVFTNISYSIKTPLMLLQNPLQNLISGFEEFSHEQVRNMLEIMNSNSKRLSLLIDQLTEIRRIDQGKVVLQLEEEDMVAFVTKIFHAFENTFMAGGIELAFTTNVTSKMILFDKIKLEVVLFNLLSNALKFSPSGSKVELSCNYISSEKRFWISVTDHGYGIDKKHLVHIFDQFWSHDLTENGKLSGAGIGLSLAKEYIELHCGEIFVESTHGEGSVFKFYLLRGNEHFKNKTAVTDSVSPGQRTVIQDYIGSISNSEKNPTEELAAKQVVVVIEENEELRIRIKKLLETHYQVFAFAGCEGVFNVISTKNPKLIITNTIFGGEPEGLSLCRIVKSNPLTNHIPLIVLTSTTNDENREEAYLLGADAYLTEPVEMEQLLTRSLNLIHLSETIRRKLRQELIVRPKEEVLQSADDKFLAKAMEIVERNIASEEFSIKQFSENMNLCSSMLYRKIKNLTGMSPNEFVKDIRLNKAAQLLASKVFRVSEVGMKVGFPDTRYFSVCFKRRFGVSPSNFESGK